MRLLVLITALFAATPSAAEMVDFMLPDVQGKPVSLSVFRGKWVIVNFWATWCPPCLEEIPGFIELQKAYGDQGLQVIGVAGDDEHAVREFARKMGFNYPVLPGDTEAAELAARYGNTMGVLPYSVIINRDREISHVIQGELSKNRAENILKDLGFNL